MALRIMLTSRQPIWIGWGEQLTYFYNDPYKSIIGGKHPWALGRPTTEVWREIWNDIGPMLETAMTGDQGTYVEAQLLIMERNGYPEETYYTFSYSPIPGDDGVVGGIICANSDDTQRVIGERQLALLRDLAADTTHARTWEEVCERSAGALRTDARDIPFALVYMAEPDGSAMRLAAVCGIERSHPAAPEAIPLDQPSFWPVGEVLRTQSLQVVANLKSEFGAGLPTGPWTEPASRAAVFPILPTGETGRAGVLVVGLNPFRLFDDNYRSFIGLVAGQISAAIANANAYEEERPGGGPSRDRSRQDDLLFERQPRVSNAAHIDADADRRRSQRSSGSASGAGATEPAGDRPSQQLALAEARELAARFLPH
jgi:hypothetical protein